MELPEHDLASALRAAGTAGARARLVAEAQGDGVTVLSVAECTMADLLAWRDAQWAQTGVYFPVDYGTPRAHDPSATVTVCVLHSPRPYPKAGPPGSGIVFHYARLFIFDDGTVWTDSLMQRPPSSPGPDAGAT